MVLTINGSVVNWVDPVDQLAQRVEQLEQQNVATNSYEALDAAIEEHIQQQEQADNTF